MKPPAMSAELEPDPLDRLQGSRTIDETATLFRLSKGTIRNRIRDGSIQTVKVGRRVLIPPDSLRRFLAG